MVLENYFLAPLATAENVLGAFEHGVRFGPGTRIEPFRFSYSFLAFSLDVGPQLPSRRVYDKNMGRFDRSFYLAYNLNA
jgi:hypothetical protein